MSTWGVLVSHSIPTSENGLQSLQSIEEAQCSKSVVVYLNKPHVVFGRRTDCDVVLTGNPCLSARHCILRVRKHSDTLNTGNTPHVIVSLEDYSRNGCRVNGILVTKASPSAPLCSGDLLELVNAGPEKHTRHNLAFVFYHINDYEAEEEEKSDGEDFPTKRYALERDGVVKPVASSIREMKDLTSTRNHLLAWALARRMYRHSVDEFYELQCDRPLGDGAFSVVYAAAICPNDTFSFSDNGIITCHQPSPETPLDKTSETSDHGGLDDDKAELLLQFLEKKPPQSVVSAAEWALRQDHAGKRSGLVYNFAVKVIAKRRMLFPKQVTEECGAVQIPPSHYNDGANGVDGSRATLRALVALETQQGEHEWERANEIRTQGQAICVPEHDWRNQRRQRKAVRDQRRAELILELSPRTRQRYENELKQKTRHRREIDILLAVDHPAITRLYEVFDGEQQLALVMERAAGGEVYGLVHRHGALPEFVVKVIVFQVLEAVLYLHRSGIIHRDLKLENLLLRHPFELGAFCEMQRAVLLERLAQYKREIEKSTKKNGPTEKEEHEQAAAKPLYDATAFTMHRTYETISTVLVPNPLSPMYTVHVGRAMWPAVQISDFGLSRMLRDVSGQHTDGYDSLIYTRHDMVTMCGTPIYVAPEVVLPSLRPPNHKGYSAAVDLFSVGVMAFALLTGRAPFAPLIDPHTGKPHDKLLDYNAPLRWERRCKETPQPTSVKLPPAAQQEYVRVPKGTKNDWRSRTVVITADAQTGEDWQSVIQEMLRTLRVAPEGALMREDIVGNESIGISSLGKQFIVALLQRDPRRRLTATAALAHPWLSDCHALSQQQQNQ